LLRGALSRTLFLTAEPRPSGATAAHARLSLGQELLLSGAVQAMIDVSDVCCRMRHIAAQSKVELELSLSRFPFKRGSSQQDFAACAAGFGDDYELLFTAPLRLGARLRN